MITKNLQGFGNLAGSVFTNQSWLFATKLNLKGFLFPARSFFDLVGMITKNLQGFGNLAGSVFTNQIWLFAAKLNLQGFLFPTRSFFDLVGMITKKPTRFWKPCRFSIYCKLNLVVPCKVEFAGFSISCKVFF
jgi:hypothetical protein